MYSLTTIHLHVHIHSHSSRLPNQIHLLHLFSLHINIHMYK